MPLIECVPNVSEGQRRDIVEAIADAVRRVRGVHLLDSSSDPSHNRSVFTLAGESEPLAGAVMALFERALPAIDLNVHRGEHPRIGAVDVVPFVPLETTSMGEAVALARQVGADVAARFGVPVYLYEQAAIDPTRTKLEDIRRGQFEGLAAKMSVDRWAPDFGPAAPHPTAGATAVGARTPLVAFNINLDTDRLEIARQIARVVRESSGGLPSVKAMGLRLAARRLVQVSMNLTDLEQTSILEAFEAVEREAVRRRVGIVESEIVGLVPSVAVGSVDPSRLRLRGALTERALEDRLRRLP
jgi:glutamate formiminotransferase